MAITILSSPDHKLKARFDEMSEGLSREDALDWMIAALAKDRDCQFQLGIVGYFIEDIPYTADSLWVSAESTPNLVETHGGFACDAFFPPGILDAPTVQARGVIVAESRTEVVPSDSK